MYTVVSLDGVVESGTVYYYQFWYDSSFPMRDFGLRSSERDTIGDLSFYRFNDAYDQFVYPLFLFDKDTTSLKIVENPFVEWAAAYFRTPNGGGEYVNCIGAGDYTYGVWSNSYGQLWFKLKDAESESYVMQNTVISMDDPYNNFWHRSEFVLCSLALVMAIIDFWVLMARSFKRKERKIL